VSDLTEQVVQGSQARELMQHPAFTRAIRALEDKYTRIWVTSEPGDQEGREHAYWALRALGEITDELNITLGNGTIAAGILEKRGS
jgi:hypothetical protein